jgi:hypothetical protein
MIDDETRRALTEVDAELQAASRATIASAWGGPAEHAVAQRRFEEVYARRETLYTAVLAACASEIEECDRIMRRLDRGRCRH